MNIPDNLHKAKVIDRKKFFTRISNGFMGLFMVSLFPFNLFGRSSSAKKIEIKINPLAVKREKDIKKNA